MKEKRCDPKCVVGWELTEDGGHSDIYEGDEALMDGAYQFCPKCGSPIIPNIPNHVIRQRGEGYSFQHSNENDKHPKEKYSKNGPFNDPVVRCDSCHKIIDRRTLHHMGCCPYCSAKKIRNLLQYTDEELSTMQEWKIDPEFIALFEPVKLPEGVNV